MAEERVLIVDDDPDILDYFSSFLRDGGYQVRSVSSGEEALPVIEAFQPAVVLLDILLPGRSGLDLLVRIRRHPRWADLPLVIITGNEGILLDDCQSYLGSHGDIRGPDAVLGKPLDREVLLDLLRDLCRDNGDRRAESALE